MQRLFASSKANVKKFRLSLRPSPLPSSGGVTLKLDHFAFTANNFTYANCGGPPLNYWNFYSDLPPSDDGVIPVWGFATVTSTQNSDIVLGDRYWGFWPMADTVSFDRPIKSNSSSFSVIRPNDKTLAPVYNVYLNTKTDPFYTHTKDCESNMMIYRPLFLTSFMLDDYLSMLKDVDEPAQIILTSASSKTAFALASLLNKRSKQSNFTVVGLTSTGNKAFCEKLNLYDEISTYGSDSISKLDCSRKTIVVDMAGSHSINVALHNHFHNNLIRNVGVGLTHNSLAPGSDDLSHHAKSVREFFFAPAWITKRLVEDSQILNTAALSYQQFVAESEKNNWVKFERTEGMDNWGDIYRLFSQTKSALRPENAHILAPYVQLNYIIQAFLALLLLLVILTGVNAAACFILLTPFSFLNPNFVSFFAKNTSTRMVPFTAAHR